MERSLNPLEQIQCVFRSFKTALQRPNELDSKYLGGWLVVMSADKELEELQGSRKHTGQAQSVGRKYINSHVKKVLILV